ncbi:MAG TPA: YdcF family protein [Patescibacteria group bacterium]
MTSETFDAAIVTGTGIKEDGSLPASAQKNIEKAIELYQSGIIPRIIFSGKWAWTLTYNPPMTESEAMKRIAITRGIPESDIITETESVTTVSNMCNVKKNILIPLGYRNLLFIVPHEVLTPRYRYNAQKVMGPSYRIEIISSDLEYPPETLAKLESSEPGKLEDAKKFYEGLTEGDHEIIYKKAMEDLEKNYINKK